MGSDEGPLKISSQNGGICIGDIIFVFAVPAAGNIWNKESLWLVQLIFTNPISWKAHKSHLDNLFQKQWQFRGPHAELESSARSGSL